MPMVVFQQVGRVKLRNIFLCAVHGDELAFKALNSNNVAANCPVNTWVAGSDFEALGQVTELQAKLETFKIYYLDIQELMAKINLNDF
ncbi:hypothetical protein RCL_jg21511.t1 [Rhizophagus clarus]|uniref:Uncharacterized protein n=1 Tax=Rhizophagus clarus TaxID=94130 RepID=A0A8H3L100_9GLOM|nr:hypothetical protein RCL_jg21511.t1 [Rhizophagus clarus]